MEYQLLSCLISLILALTLRRQLLLAVQVPTPAGAILITSMVYVLGTTIVLWRKNDEISLFVYSAVVVMFTCYLLGFHALAKALSLRAIPRPLNEVSVSQEILRPSMLWLIFALAFAACVLIVGVTGADRILRALFDFIVFGDIDVSVLELRVGLATGEERWVAPGYTKQIRDVLLPLFTLLLLFTVKRSARVFIGLALVLVPAVSVLIISTGERGPILLFMIGLCYVARRNVEWGLQSARSAIVSISLIGVTAIAAFTFLTSSFTSRGYEDASAVEVIADRIMTRGPEENILGASVWGRGAPFPGAGWLSELASVLPGTQFTLSSLIHEYLGGGDLGNSVLGTWVDVFYNFGWWLGVPVSLLIGMSIALFNHWVNVARVTSRAAEVCALWLSVCMLTVFSPFGFLLYGPFVLSTVLLLGVVLAGRPNLRASSVFVGTKPGLTTDGPVATR